jgi:HEAT repeat protein
VAAERLAASSSRDDRAHAATRALEDVEAEVRRAAVAAFAGHPSPEARRVLDGAIRDPHRSVRAAAMRLASALGGADVVELVRRTAEADRADDVRGEALVALAAMEPAGALSLVSRAFFEPALAPYAVRALERIAERDPEALRQFHDAAPPRVAFVADVFLAGQAR